MAMNPMQCKGCGGTLELRPAGTHMRCPWCGRFYIVERTGLVAAAPPLPQQPDYDHPLTCPVLRPQIAPLGKRYMENHTELKRARFALFRAQVSWIPWWARNRKERQIQQHNRIKKLLAKIAALEQEKASIELEVRALTTWNIHTYEPNPNDPSFPVRNPIDLQPDGQSWCLKRGDRRVAMSETITIKPMRKADGHQ